MASIVPQMSTVPELSAVVSSGPPARPVLNTTLNDKRPLSTATDTSSVLSSVDSPKGDLAPLPSSPTSPTSPRKHKKHHHHHHHHHRHSHRHSKAREAATPINEKNGEQLLSPADTARSHPSEIMTLPNSSALAPDLEDPQNQPNLYETMQTPPKAPSFLRRHLFVIMVALCLAIVLAVVLGVAISTVIRGRRHNIVAVTTTTGS